MQISNPSAGPTSPGHSSGSLILPGSTLPFALVTALFFLWGMSNNLTDILVQQFRKGFTLTQLEAQLVQTAVFLGYFLMALPAAAFMRKYGYKAGILLGLLLFATGTLLFWPAAVIGRYAPFLVALFFVGCGSATLETAANPLVAEFGEPSASERRLNFAQSFNPIGSITGVVAGTYLIFSGVELTPEKISALQRANQYQAYIHGEITRVVPTYIALAIAVLLSAALIARTRFPAFAVSGQGTSPTGTLRDLLPYRHLWLSVAAQFFYCGAQVCTWSAFIPYLKQYTRMFRARRRLAPRRVPAGARCRPAHLHRTHAALPPNLHDPRLRHHQHGAPGPRRRSPRLGRRLRHPHHQPLHVHHLPHHLCPRH